MNAQNCYVFIGSYNWDATKEGIYVYVLDTSNGRLQKVTSVSNVLNPTFLTISANKKFVYACTEAKTPKAGSVSSFAFDAQQKTLRFINKQKSGGENPVFLTTDTLNKWLVNANYTEGSVSVFPLGSNGEIMPSVQVIAFADSSIDKERQERAHIHAAVFSPSFDFVFLPDLGADKIRCYPFDISGEQPLQETKYKFTTTTSGAGPRHFNFHPNGKYAYSIEELTGNIVSYHYANGNLDSFQRVYTYKKQYKEKVSSADIHISPDGKFLYGSNRGQENSLAIFLIQKNGRLKLVGHQNTGGEIPRNFAMDVSGKFLLVANQATGNVVVFRRNSKTGLLKKTGTVIKILNPTCIKVCIVE